MAGGSWVRLIPLGGLGEIGPNMTCLETAEGCVVLDAGIMFPPFVATQRHEDHTGALPYLLRGLPVLVDGTPPTPALAHQRLREAGLEPAADLRPITPDDRLDFGSLRPEFVRVCHSIPDGAAVVARTPAGLAVHTADFKLDPTPGDGVGTDEERFAALGDEGVLALLSDSTYAARLGPTPGTVGGGALWACPPQGIGGPGAAGPEDPYPHALVHPEGGGPAPPGPSRAAGY